MQNDAVTWEILSKGKCSFRKNLENKETFCVNEYNVTGICSRVNCPLSNSVYATVLLDRGELYLYIKTAERYHSPCKLWHRIQLGLNRKKAFQIIHSEMKFLFTRRHIKKCMKRYARLKEILKRSRRLVLEKQVNLIPVKKKTERRDQIRETKALKAAHLVNKVEEELLSRLNEGVYGKLYNFLKQKRKIKNKDSELSKICHELEDPLIKKKKEKGKEELEILEEDLEEEDFDDDEEEEDGEDDEEYEEDDNSDNSDDEDEGDYDDDDDDDNFDDEDEGDYDDDDYDEEEEEEEIEAKKKLKKGSSKTKKSKNIKRKGYNKEYMTNEYIQQLQETGQLPNDDEIDELSSQIKKKKKAASIKQDKKKRLTLTYEN